MLGVICSIHERKEEPRGFGADQIRLWGCTGSSAPLNLVQNRKQRRNRGAEVTREPCKGGGNGMQLLSPKGDPQSQKPFGSRSSLQDNSALELDIP